MSFRLIKNFLILLPLVAIKLSFGNNINTTMIKRYEHNPNLRTINTDLTWKGVPVNKYNMYTNLDSRVLPKFSNLLKWLFSKNPQRKEKKADTWRAEVISNGNFIKDPDNKFVWLGHSSFYMQINGIRILIDPILSKNYMHRFAGFPANINDYKNIDYILISHNHRDHADKESIKTLAQNNPNAVFLAGLGMDKKLKCWLKGQKIQAAGWYQQFNTDTDKIKIFFLPTQHWSKRGLFDTNKTLWGAFVIQFNNTTIYWAGDSGHGSHYEKAAKFFPKIDYCFMPVGAFKPEWFMSPQHISPSEAVDYFNIMGGHNFVPMHYGTYDLSDEPIGEPYRTIKQLNTDGKIKGRLIMPRIGEIVNW